MVVIRVLVYVLWYDELVVVLVEWVCMYVCIGGLYEEGVFYGFLSSVV